MAAASQQASHNCGPLAPRRFGGGADAAKTYAEINKIEATARALKILFAEVQEVRAKADEVILLASHRIGEEIKTLPVDVYVAATYFTSTCSIVPLNLNGFLS